MTGRRVMSQQCNMCSLEQKEDAMLTSSVRMMRRVFCCMRRTDGGTAAPLPPEACTVQADE